MSAQGFEPVQYGAQEACGGFRLVRHVGALRKDERSRGFDSGLGQRRAVTGGVEAVGPQQRDLDEVESGLGRGADGPVAGLGCPIGDPDERVRSELQLLLPSGWLGRGARGSLARALAVCDPPLRTLSRLPAGNLPAGKATRSRTRRCSPG
jgi:hypothetical protein